MPTQLQHPNRFSPWQWLLDPKNRCLIFKALAIIGMISLYLTLWVPISDEEGNYTINAMEMAQSGHFWNNTIAGSFYPRPPLMKFLVMCVARVIGFKHVLIASRLVSATATVGIAWLTFFFTRALSKNREWAWLCTAIYLSGDCLMRRGWLAYADPTYSFFVMASMVSLWWAVQTKQYRWLLIGCIGVFCAFISKDLRAFTFYGSLGLILLIRHPNRWFLLRPMSWVFHLALIASPFIWAHFTVPAYLSSMVLDLRQPFSNTWPNYLFDVFWYSPVMLIVRLLPISVLALWAVIKQWGANRHELEQHSLYNIVIIALITALINWIPLWLSWGAWPAARYIMPVYPFFAISMAAVIISTTEKRKTWAVILLCLFMLAKWLTAPWLWTWIQNKFHHGLQLKPIATQSLKIVGEKPLYISGIGGAYMEQMAHTINVIRWPEPTIKNDSLATERTYYVLRRHVQAGDKLIHQWRQPQSDWQISLVCRGIHCPNTKSAITRLPPRWNPLR